jgi:hypothetical protein
LLLDSMDKLATLDLLKTCAHKSDLTIGKIKIKKGQFSLTVRSAAAAPCAAGP